MPLGRERSAAHGEVVDGEVMRVPDAASSGAAPRAAPPPPPRPCAAADSPASTSVGRRRRRDRVGAARVGVRVAGAEPRALVCVGSREGSRALPERRCPLTESSPSRRPGLGRG